VADDVEQRRRTLWRLLLAAFTLLIIHASLYPWDLGSRTPPAAPFLFTHRLNRFLLRDAVSNLLFYAPFGATFVLAARHKSIRVVFSAIAAAALLSGTLETIQTTQITRSSNALDFICNVTGTALAALATLFYRDRIRRASAALETHPQATPAAGILLALWLCFKFYPGLPLLSRTRLLERFTAAAHTPVSGWEIAAFAAEWIAVARLIELGTGRSVGCLAVVAAVLIVPARLLFDGAVPGFSELVGACLGVLIWANWVAGRTRGTAIAAWAAVGSLAIASLAPFDFQGPAQAFGWMPFGATLEAERTSAIRVLLEKLFRYGAAFWLLHRSGMRHLRAAALVVAVAFSVETLQMWLPGRSPEITDVLLALFVAGAIAALEIRGEHRHAVESPTGSSSGSRAD
jgi:VanZ family protein